MVMLLVVGQKLKIEKGEDEKRVEESGTEMETEDCC